MKTMMKAARKTKMRSFYLSLVAGMMMLCMPEFGNAQGPLYRELGKKVFDTSAMIRAERVTAYGLEHLFGKGANLIHANPIRVNIYNPYNGIANFSVTENGEQWYELRIPRGYYVQLRTEFYPIVAIRTPKGLLYYLTSPGTYYVPANSLGS